MNKNIQNSNELTDQELLLDAQSGDSFATDTLVRRYTRLVKSCVRPYFLAGADEEDLLQEGMLGLLSAIRSFQVSREIPFWNYAKICIEHSIVSAVRVAMSRKQEPLNNSLALDMYFSGNVANAINPEIDPESCIISSEAHSERLSKLLTILSEFEAKVLSLFLEGCSYEEMARKLDKPVKSVDNAIQRIRRKSAAIFLKAHPGPVPDRKYNFTSVPKKGQQ